MDTKYVNDKINKIFDNTEYEKLPGEAVDKIFGMMEGFEFKDNDDFRILSARLYQQYLAEFNRAWGMKFLKTMNYDNVEESKKL